MHRADNRAAVSQSRFGHRAGNSKVGNFGVPVVGHQNVVRFYVAVDDIVCVRVRQTLRNVFGNGNGRRQVERAFVFGFSS